MRFAEKLGLVVLGAALLTAGGCQEAEPVLPEETLAEIQDALGYAIAPTWLPQGLVFKVADAASLQGDMVTISYAEGERELLLEYPAPMPYYLGGENYLKDSLGLDWQPPEDSVATFNVNGEYGYMIYGLWSEDTLNALANMDEDLYTMAPEWDYDLCKTLRFGQQIDGGESVNIRLYVMFDAQWITDEEMIRIAESCVQVE